MFLYLEGRGLPQCKRHYSEFFAYFTKEDWRYRGVRKGRCRREEGRRREGGREKGRRKGGEGKEEGRKREDVGRRKGGVGG